MGGYPVWKALLGIPPAEYRDGPTADTPPTPVLHTRSLEQITDAHIAAQATSPADIRALPAVAGAVRLIASTIDQIPVTVAGGDSPPWLADPRSTGGQLDAGDLVQHCVDSMVTYGRAFLWCTPMATPNMWRLDAVDPNYVNVLRDVSTGLVARRFMLAGKPVEEVPYTAAAARGPVLLHIPFVVTVEHPEGTTPLTQAARILRGHVDTERLVADMFAQGGTRVGGFLTTPGDLTPNQAKDWQTAWTETPTGRIRVLGNGLEYRNEAPNARDLQLVEARSFNQSVVWALLGIPLAYMGSSLMGGQSSLSYNNAQDNRRQFADNCLRAFTTQIGDALSRLLPRGQTVAFDYTEWEGRPDDGTADDPGVGIPSA